MQQACGYLHMFYEIMPQSSYHYMRSPNSKLDVLLLLIIQWRAFTLKNFSNLLFFSYWLDGRLPLGYKLYASTIQRSLLMKVSSLCAMIKGKRDRDDMFSHMYDKPIGGENNGVNYQSYSFNHRYVYKRDM